jgi:hypothetical protein
MVMRNKVIILLALVLLITVLSACHATAEGPLPHSMKGYELYSWQEQGQWHFTLITGTNRNKNMEEIVSGENIVAADGWVDIHAVGVEEIKSVLSKIPENEFVFWSRGHWVIPGEPEDITLTLPPAEIIDAVKAHVDKYGLDFLVDSF